MTIVTTAAAYERAQTAADQVVDQATTDSDLPPSTLGREQVRRAGWSGHETGLVHATLHGCVDALNRYGVTAADVGDTSFVPPAGLDVTCLDVARAEGWLAVSLVDELGVEQRRALVDVYVVAEDWADDVQQIASMVDATVLVARAARRRASERRALDRRRPRSGALHLVPDGIPA